MPKSLTTVSELFLDLQDKVNILIFCLFQGYIIVVTVPAFSLRVQCSDVVDRNTVDQCAQELSYAATHNLSLPADISTTVSLLQAMVQALFEDGAQAPSTMTSQVYTFLMMSLYYQL